MIATVLFDYVAVVFGPRTASLFRSGFYLPQVLPVAVAGIVWGWILHPSHGALNSLLQGAGVPSLASNWLGDPSYAEQRGPGEAVVSARSATVGGPDHDHADGVTLRVHGPCDGARLTVSIPAPSGGDGVRFAIERAGRELRIERSGPPAPWRVLVVGQHTISASPGPVIPSPDGALVDLVMNVAFTVILLSNTQDQIMSAE